LLENSIKQFKFDNIVELFNIVDEFVEGSVKLLSDKLSKSIESASDHNNNLQADNNNKRKREDETRKCYSYGRIGHISKNYRSTSNNRINKLKLLKMDSKVTTQFKNHYNLQIITTTIIIK
jgi:DNA polymerase III delta prime subunit